MNVIRLLSRISGFVLIVIIILIIVLLLKVVKFKPSPSTISSPTPVPTAYSTPYVAYNKTITDIVKNMKISKLGGLLPPNLGLNPGLFSRADIAKHKSSLTGKYISTISADELVITDKLGNRHMVVEVSQGTDKVNYIWLNDKFLLYIEKEKAFRKIDRLYLIDVDNKMKHFLAGSFPIPDRLDLTIDPVVLNNGSLIIFRDNVGQYWKIDLEFNKQ